MIKAFLLFFLSINLSFGQDFKKEVDDVYNFHPHQLSKEEQNQKFSALDKLFEKIKSDTTTYLPLLRKELSSTGHYPYFYYDCSHLLLIISKGRLDEELAASAFSKANIKDLDPKIYTSLLSYLSNKNMNVTKAAVKILEDSTFSFFVPEHAMNFMQGYCLMYCLLPLDPKLYIDTLTTIFKQTKQIQVQKSIITTLWFSYSCSGDKFLESLNNTNTLSNEVSNYSKKLMSNLELDRDYKKLLKKITSSELEEMKRAALKTFSDEAIWDLDFVAKANRKKFNCR